MPDNEYADEYEPKELELPKPLSPERKAEIDELYARIAADLEMING